MLDWIRLCEIQIHRRLSSARIYAPIGPNPHACAHTSFSRQDQAKNGQDRESEPAALPGSLNYGAPNQRAAKLRNMKLRDPMPALATSLLSLLSALCNAQTSPAAGAASGAQALAGYSIEGLNLVGAPVTMPLISDTLLGVESDFRRTLFSKGVLLRANVLPRISANLLDPPAPPDQQAYIGHRPTWITGVNPILTADLRQLHLRNAQLNIGAAWRWTTWNPAGPKTIALSTLYLYKMWREGQVEIKAGYITNDIEFVGIQVGGSLATGAQGVYAVLPFQVGMSYFPLTAPSFNIRVRGPRFTYVKVGVQRSLDAEGGVSTEARNNVGFRFIPKGDRLLLINEAGYVRTSGPDSHYAWIRAGYLHNDTPYVNKSNGRAEPGNYCAYGLVDYQIHDAESGSSGRGYYLGATVMIAPERYNAYHRYYEARVYRKAPFARRPDDVLSIVAAYRSHSGYVTPSLAAQGKTFWRGSPSLTGNYSMHVSRGNYLTLALGYVRGAAITPRVADALVFTTNWGLYF
jgi:porin